MSTETLAARRRRPSALMGGLVRPLLNPILAILIAVAVGAILVAGVGENPIDVYATLVEGRLAKSLRRVAADDAAHLHRPRRGFVLSCRIVEHRRRGADADGRARSRHSRLRSSSAGRAAHPALRERGFSRRGAVGGGPSALACLSQRQRARCLPDDEPDRAALDGLCVGAGAEGPGTDKQTAGHP